MPAAEALQCRVDDASHSPGNLGLSLSTSVLKYFPNLVLAICLLAAFIVFEQPLKILILPLMARQ
jgi:hypothetical protein